MSAREIPKGLPVQDRIEQLPAVRFTPARDPKIYQGKICHMQCSAVQCSVMCARLSCFSNTIAVALKK
jgi:hypothetical protein